MNRLIFARAGALALALGLGSYAVLQASLSGCDAAQETAADKEPLAATAEPVAVENEPPPQAPAPSVEPDTAPAVAALPVPSSASSPSAPAVSPPRPPRFLPGTKSGAVTPYPVQGSAPKPQLQRSTQPPPQPPPPGNHPNPAPR